MGQAFHTYGRLAQTNTWFDNALYTTTDSFEKVIGKFKHQVYSYALQRRYKDMKAIYLYHGYTRLAKAELETPTAGKTNTLTLSFADEDTLKKFDDAGETLIDFDTTFQERSFYNKFILIHANKSNNIVQDPSKCVFKTRTTFGGTSTSKFKIRPTSPASKIHKIT